MTEEELCSPARAAWSNEGFLSRDHEEAPPGCRPGDASRGSGRRQLEPGAVVPAYVEREFTLPLGGDRIRGRWDRVDIEPADDGAAAPARIVAPTAARRHDRADARARRGRERVTITDYKSSDVRGPGEGPPARPGLAPAPDLRDGLRGGGRPSAGLPSSSTSSTPALVGRAEVDRDGGSPADGSGSRSPAAGIRAGDETPRSRSAMTPAAIARSGRSVRPASRRDARRSHGIVGDHASTSGTRSCPSDGTRCGAVVELTADGVSRADPTIDRAAFLAAWAEERERQFRENVPPQFREVDLGRAARPRRSPGSGA